MVQFERKMQIPTEAGGILPNSCMQSAWPGCSWTAVQDPGSSLRFSCNFYPHIYCTITRSSSRRYSNPHSMFYNTLKFLKGKIKKSLGFSAINCTVFCWYPFDLIRHHRALKEQVQQFLWISTTVGQIIHNKLFPGSNSPKRYFSPIILLN